MIKKNAIIVIITVFTIGLLVYLLGYTSGRRPQEPQKPYSYYTEEVIFSNSKDNITLAGTLTLPSKEGHYPAVILITGTGPQNRDGEIWGHKPFLLISDYLTRNGIAVLRYDDRGVGQSKRSFTSELTTLDFAGDAESALEYLKTRKEINRQKIGLMGHSEGGLTASILASESEDVAFMVMLGGMGIRGDKLLAMQSELIARAMKLPESEIESSNMFMKEISRLTSTTADGRSFKANLTKFVQKNLNEVSHWKEHF